MPSHIYIRVGRYQDAVAANEAAIPVSTIAFGTDDGIIEIPQEPLPIAVPVDEAALRNIADGTGGTFFTAGTTAELESVYQDLGSSVGFETEQREISGWFIGAALLALALTAVFSLAWFSRLP